MTTLVVPPGTVFGRLAVIREATRAADGARRMLCGCECGTETIVHLKNLRSGHTKSCGCRGTARPDLSELRSGEIPLHGRKAAGRVVLVDDSDYGLVMQYRWHVFEQVRKGRVHGPYAITSVNHSREKHLVVYMHKLLTGWPLVDHIDGNGLNNQRSNLRAATNSQNLRNSGPRGGSSQFKGVFRYRNGRWQSSIMVDGKSTHLGYFVEEVEAALAYDAAALRLHGPFARLNFSSDGGTPPPKICLDKHPKEEAQG